jgi:transglutaminase-like putative cysteine protease
MSARAAGLDDDERGMLRRGPEEGWLVVALSAILALIVAFALDEPAWVNGRGALTDSLPLCALGGLAFGMVGPKVGWGRWTSHTIGAIFAGLLIPILAGWAMVPGSAAWEAFRRTADGTAQAYIDIALRNLQYTNQEVHYVLVLGAVTWATAQFLGYAVFGHRRPLNGILMTGIVLLSNMALTTKDELGLLVAFTIASLFLLIEMRAFDERAMWLRRRIGDPSAIASLYLRGGTVFIVAAVIGSLVLTQRAASAPLAGAWSGISDQLSDVGQEIGRVFPVGPDVRGSGGVDFGPTAKIQSRWTSDDGVAFEATVPVGAGGERWRVATYDTFALGAWVQTAVTSVPRAPGEPLLQDTAEDPDPARTTSVEVTVRPENYHGGLLLAQGAPVTVDRTADVLVQGDAGWFAGVDLPGGRDPYTVTSAVLNIGEDAGVTKNGLRAAPEVYPAEITARYTAIPEGAIGTDAADLLQTILQITPSRDPLDLAVTMEAYLRSDTLYHYSTDISGVTCDSASAVECFARNKLGYCMHYASTMAILLRAANPDNPIPTRLVQGFLPGLQVDTTETVLNRNAHAWVEVYFPGYGWIPFDPTGGGVGRPSAIPAGPSVAPVSPGPSPVASIGTADEKALRAARASAAAGLSGGSGTDAPGDRTILVLIALLGGLLVAVGAAAAWARGPRGEVSPDIAWHAMSRAAARFGFAPRPTQTVYEYADTLATLVPVARGDLQVVADAKVETAYARAQLDEDRLTAVRDAMRRLRFSLLRLLVRRGRAPRGRS